MGPVVDEVTASKSAREIADNLRAMGLRYEGFVDLAHLIDALGLDTMEETLRFMSANNTSAPSKRTTA